MKFSSRSATLALCCLVVSGIRSVGQESTPKESDNTLPSGPASVPAKLTHEPKRLPDRIILTWADDPCTTQSVTWRTSVAVQASLGQIALSEVGPGFDPIGKKSSTPNTKIVQVPAQTEYLKTDLSEAHYHSLTFRDLVPATQYVYRVGDGTNFSEWFQFETASDKPEPFGFIYFGDAQNDLKRHWSRVVRGAYSDMPKAKFIIHAGDLINSGNSDADWGDWNQAAGWINGMVPSVATPGNHEYSGPKVNKQSTVSNHWRKQFTQPDVGLVGLEETVFRMDYQGVRFISLNSNERQAEQIDWLKSQLQNNPNRWTILTFHHPIYSTAKGRDNKKLRELWRPIFDEYPVDLVLQGHDHTYGRSGIMLEDNLLSGATTRVGRGTVYVVSVSGPKMYNLESQPWMVAKAEQTQLYQLITIDGDRLHYQSRTAMGNIYDEFQLVKSDAGNELLESNQFNSESAKYDSPQDLRVAVGAIVGLSVVALTVSWYRRRGKSVSTSPPAAPIA